MISKMRKSKEHLHKSFCEEARRFPNAELLLIGDSIVRHFEKYLINININIPGINFNTRKINPT